MRRARAVPIFVILATFACGSKYGEDLPIAKPEEKIPDQIDELEVTPSVIDFGAVNCGSELGNAPPIVVRNKGTRPLHYGLEVPDGAAFAFQGSVAGNLDPGATASINVIARPKTAGDNVTDVTIATATTFAQVKLQAKGGGGQLDVLPGSVDIGAVRYQSGGSVDVELENAGTQQITIAGFDGTDANFDVTWTGKPAPLVLDPATTKTITVKLTPAAAPGEPLAIALTPKVTGAYCGVPPPLPVKGQRVNLDVILSNADFGKQPCNTPPTLQKDVVISNYTSQALSYSAVLKKGATSAYKIVSGAADSIPPGSASMPTTKSIKLSMLPIGTNVGVLSEVLDVTVNGIAAPSGGLRTATVSADVRGVVLIVNPANMAGFQYRETRSYTLKNDGNEPASLSTSFARDPGTTQAPAWINGSPGSVGAMSSANATVRFMPSVQGNYGGTYTFGVTNGQPICNGTPTLHVTGSASP